MFSPKRRPPCVLVVDDNLDTREFVGRVLTDQGCDVHLAIDGEQALAMADNLRPKVVYLDINMPKQDGWLVCAKLKYFHRSPFVVLMTGVLRDDLFRFTKFVRADEVLRKPFEAGDLIELLPFSMV